MATTNTKDVKDAKDVNENQNIDIEFTEDKSEVKEAKATTKLIKKSATAKSKAEKADGYMDTNEALGAVKESITNRKLKPGEFREVNIPISEDEVKRTMDEAIAEIEKETSHINKTMGNTDQNGCKKNVKDVVMFGDDLFKLLSKASSENEGWMKSTKAMDTGTGCVVQVTTQQRNFDGSYSVAEALTFVSGVKIREMYAGGIGGTATARCLVARH